MSIVVEVWEPTSQQRAHGLLHELPTFGLGSNTFIVDVFDNDETTTNLYRARYNCNATLPKVRECVQKHRDEWLTRRAQAQAVPARPEQSERKGALDAIVEVSESNLTSSTKLKLIQLICKEQQCSSKK